jgi:hypothetical protein
VRYSTAPHGDVEDLRAQGRARAEQNTEEKKSVRNQILDILLACFPAAGKLGKSLRLILVVAEAPILALPKGSFCLRSEIFVSQLILALVSGLWGEQWLFLRLTYSSACLRTLVKTSIDAVFPHFHFGRNDDRSRLAGLVICSY